MTERKGFVTPGLLMGACLALPGCAATDYRMLVTIADAQTGPATLVDVGETGDSVGDMVLFDQPLLGEECDGGDYNKATCSRLGFGGGGSLGCTSNCTLNYDSCCSGCDRLDPDNDNDGCPDERDWTPDGDTPEPVMPGVRILYVADLDGLV